MVVMVTMELVMVTMVLAKCNECGGDHGDPAKRDSNALVIQVC